MTIFYVNILKMRKERYMYACSEKPSTNNIVRLGVTQAGV